MRKLNIFVANMLFMLHCFVGVIILVGWLFPQFKILYLALLAVWIFSWVCLGYCPLTKWEFFLRRKYDKNLDPNAEAIKYYMFKFFKKDIPSKRIFTCGLIVFITLTVLTLI